ncbi:ATP-binding protein [Streptomyces hainanensis]|uniref:ATP-binding protein n=1 Tax=Streptomyces hainanensis TaxID=402648 RepID=A0A4R4TP34_9ACTN|nr:ATP-binding protein [Streptomyces hainanensis]TDC79958.1 ATP-binding protein [Streptomyces hainanensis]
MLHTFQQPVIAAQGFYVKPRTIGFAAYLSASAAHLRLVRQLTALTLREAGVDAGMCDNVQLVASELIGNSVRACGDHVPLVVEVDAGPAGVWVKVHDPDADRLPERSAMPLDDDVAESGRGLGLVDYLAPGWQVRVTPLGKQLVCWLPLRPR